MHWGEMGSRWGVNRSVAQTHALLFLADRPLPAEKIATALGVARSNVSTSLKDLQAWGLVQVTHLFGDRRDHFVTPKDLQEVARIVLEGRKRRELDPTLALVRECAKAADASTPPAVKARLADTLEFMEMIEAWSAEMRQLESGSWMQLMKIAAKVAKRVHENARGSAGPAG